MYRNLQAEFSRLNIPPVKGIANALDCTERCARNKLKGITAITISEAKKIHKKYFPSLTLDYLFETVTDKAN